MDHELAAAFELDGHDLQRNSVRVVTEVDEPRVAARRPTSGRVLLEDEATSFDDVARSLTGDPVPRCGASPFEIHAIMLSILSDDIMAFPPKRPRAPGREVTNAPSGAYTCSDPVRDGQSVFQRLADGALHLLRLSARVKTVEIVRSGFVPMSPRTPVGSAVPLGAAACPEVNSSGSAEL